MLQDLPPIASDNLIDNNVEENKLKDVKKAECQVK